MCCHGLSVMHTKSKQTQTIHNTTNTHHNCLLQYSCECFTAVTRILTACIICPVYCSVPFRSCCYKIFFERFCNCDVLLSFEKDCTNNNLFRKIFQHTITFIFRKRFTCKCILFMSMTTCTHHIHRDALQRPHFIWLDNFSKFISRSVPTSEKGVFAECLWTGVAIFKCSSQNVTDAVNRDDQGNVVPAMPIHILQNRNSVMSVLQNVIDEGVEYYDKSLVRQYDVRNVPLKIDVRRFPAMRATVESYTMNDVQPLKLLKVNIGSNDGLLHILREIYVENTMHEDNKCQRYVSINADENIYWRILKVCTWFCLSM